MAVRFLHLSDLDLGASPAFMGTSSEARSHEILETFRDAIGFVLDPVNRIDAVLISGNLFDRHRPSADLPYFSKAAWVEAVVCTKVRCPAMSSRASAGLRR